MIAIVDTGGANLASVSNALERLGRQSVVTADPATIARASHVILPGVGAAGHSMERLRRSEVVGCLRELKRPVLGICLGMQLLFEHSEEGDTDCLGLLPGTVRRIRPAEKLTVPHMGWNQLRREATPSVLLEGIAEDRHFYFVHSYIAPLGPWVRACFEYGGSHTAMVEKPPYYGVQFHPERSADAGARLLENFLRL